MKLPHPEFFRKLLIFSAFITVPATAITFLLPGSFITPTLPFQFLFFIIVTFLSYHLISGSSEKKFIRFLNVYMIITIVKLFFFIAILVAYILLNRPDAVPFVLSFFILYLCYTIFEVIQIVSLSRMKQENS